MGDKYTRTACFVAGEVVVVVVVVTPVPDGK